jgi:hypothetical protein
MFSPQRSVCGWIEIFKRGRTSVVDIGRSGRSSTSTSEQNIERAKAVILEKLIVTFAEIVAKLGISVDSTHVVGANL